MGAGSYKGVTTMGIDDYLSQDETQQKETHITLSNPEHPETSASYADEETIREHFDAAITIQNSAVDRTMVTGEFLVALEKFMEDEDPEHLREFCSQLVE